MTELVHNAEPVPQITKEDLIKMGTITGEQFNFLVKALKHKKNILISGPVGSGKSTLAYVLEETLWGKEHVNDSVFFEIQTGKDYADTVYRERRFVIGAEKTINASDPSDVVPRLNQFADENNLSHRYDLFHLTVFIRQLPDGTRKVTNIAPYPTKSQQRPENMPVFRRDYYQEDL